MSDTHSDTDLCDPVPRPGPNLGDIAVKVVELLDGLDICSANVILNHLVPGMIHRGTIVNAQSAIAAK